MLQANVAPPTDDDALSPEEVAELRRLVATDGVNRTALRLGLSRHGVMALLGAPERVRRGTRAQLRAALARLGGGHAP